MMSTGSLSARTSGVGTPVPVGDNAVRLREAIVGSIPNLSLGPWTFGPDGVSALQFHHNNRLVFCRLHRTADEGGYRDAVIKLYGAGSARYEYEALTFLWNCGFRPPAPAQVPEVLGHSADFCAFVEARLKGIWWSDMLPVGGHGLVDAAEGAAAWLVALQQRPVEVLFAAEQPADTEVVHWTEDLAHRFPRWEPALNTFAHDLQLRLRQQSTPPVLSHGDFHPGNVLLGMGATVAIDLEDFGVRGASFDVGSCIAHTLTMSYFRLGTFDPGARACVAFWHRYAQEMDTPWEDVAAAAAQVALKNLHYALGAAHAGADALIEVWMRTMTRWLSSAGPTDLQSTG